MRLQTAIDRCVWHASSRRAGNDASFQRAFTLIELMVVITVIAIVTGVMVLEMQETLEDALLRSTARKLIAACDIASNRAIAVNQTQILKIDAAAGKFLVEAKARDLDERDAVTAEGELDTRIRLTIREPQRDEEADEGHSDEMESSAPLNAITFYPDGSADAREFIFRDRAGVELVVRINPTTSRTRIIEMAAQ